MWLTQRNGVLHFDGLDTVKSQACLDTTSQSIVAFQRDDRMICLSGTVR